MRRKFYFLFMLICCMLMSTSAWADIAVLASPSGQVSELSDADGIITITDKSTSGGIQKGSGSFTYGEVGYTPMKLSGSRQFSLTYSSDVTINSVTLICTDNKGDGTTYTIGDSSSDRTNIGNLAAKGSTPSQFDIKDKEGLNASVQFLAIIVVDYTKPEATSPTIKASVNTLDLSLASYNASKSATVKLTGEKLTDGTYDVTTSVEGLSISPASFTVASGKVEQEFTVTYASTAAVTSASETITFQSAEKDNVSATTEVTYGKVAQRGITSATSISDSYKWDFSKAGTTAQLTDATSPSKTDEFILANIAEVTNDDNFKSDALTVQCEFPVRDGKYFQGGYLKFNTTVAGKVKVVFSNTGNRSNEADRRYLYVNGTNTKVSSLRSDATVTAEVDVEAGDVVLTAFINGNENPQYIRINSVEFVKNAEGGEEPGQEPEDPNFDIKEKVVYQTKFQDWTKASASTEPSDVEVKTTDGQALTFTLFNTAVDPEGTNTKFSAECVTTGYLQTAKDETNVAYVSTSTLGSVTKLEIVQAATGTGRGITVYVKGDKDEDWVALHNKGIVTAAGETLTLDVNRENCQIKFGTFAAGQNAYVTSMKIYGNVKVAKRTFKPVKIDFRTDPYTVVEPEAGLPEDVTVSGTFHDGQHGYSGATVTVPVDGPVKFTIGGCGYTNQATVSIDGGDAISIATKAAGCDNGFGTYTKFATYTYNVEKAATLTFNLGSYCPYFFAEACEFVPSVEVSYYNTDGTLIGTQTIDGGSELAYKYGASDVTVPEGQAFRGWFDSKATTAQKVAEGKAVTEDLKLYAHATAVETAVTGTHYMYDLTKAYFYPEDHENLTVTGKYHGSHGFTFGNGESMTLKVSPKAQVMVGLCTYTNTSDQVVVNKAGETVTTLSVIKDGNEGATPDGKIHSFYYANPNGEADELTFKFTTSTYIHSLEVYNVEGQLEKDATGYYTIASGDAASLMLMLKSAQDGDKIFLPNGTYDLGETVLTTISADNVSIIGESMEGTIIKNAPDKSTESINNTATLLNTSTGLYLQDLTLQNALDYYANNNGRAVCLQDKGTNTICKNVRMLSYQDTYYSNKVGAQNYFEGGEIHGTVDYICGNGSVYFKNVGLFCEKRQANGGGSDAITASNADDSDKGYVFEGCTIKYAEGMTESELPVVSLGRAWNNAPQCVYLNTIVDDANGRVSFQDANQTIIRWTLLTMNNGVFPKLFGEYNTVNTYGDCIISGTNKLTFTDKGGFTDGTDGMETILTADQAAKYTIGYVLGDWAARAQADATQVTEMPASTEDLVYLVPGDGTTPSYITTTCPESGKVRIANGRGGFGPEITLGVPTAIDTVSADADANAPLYNLAGQRVNASAKGIIIRNGRKMVK